MKIIIDGLDKDQWGRALYCIGIYKRDWVTKRKLGARNAVIYGQNFSLGAYTTL